MENLQQIVVQITSSPEVRAIIQYGEGFLPNSQNLINYNDLNNDEKIIWDNFVNMIKDK
jgi:hypothetical protein